MSKSLSAAVSFLPAAWGGAWLVLLLLWAAGTGGPMVLMHHHLPLAGLGLIIVVVILHVMAFGALYRVALFGRSAGKEGLGFGGVQLGWPELRLVIARIVATLFILVIAAAIVIVFAMAIGIAGGQGDAGPAICVAFKRHMTPGDWGVIAYVVASLFLLVFVTIKFALLNAANIAERRLVTLNALGLSSGNVGRLFIGMVVLAVPFMVVSGLVMHHFGQQIHLAHAMPYPWMSRQLHVLLHGGLMALHIGLWLPLSVGFFASAYSQIAAARSK
ncbi:MAG: hypothetical protein JF615_08265 [Asticcacaulis sp.]|nr:hypothetical protein [Asticcacaulis sp.]